MDAIFALADELGPLKVIHFQEQSIGLKGVLVVDNVAKGPSIGGIRMAPDVTTGECARLARAMTFKNAAAGLPHGGGKVVLIGDPKMPADAKQQHIRALAQLLRGEQEYIFAPDMGTNEECMAWVRDEISRVVALPREIGGIPLDEIGATGFGLAICAEVATVSTQSRWAETTASRTLPGRSSYSHDAETKGQPPGVTLPSSQVASVRTKLRASIGSGFAGRRNLPLLLAHGVE